MQVEAKINASRKRVAYSTVPKHQENKSLANTLTLTLSHLIIHGRALHLGCTKSRGICTWPLAGLVQLIPKRMQGECRMLSPLFMMFLHHLTGPPSHPHIIIASYYLLKVYLLPTYRLLALNLACQSSTEDYLFYPFLFLTYTQDYQPNILISRHSGS